MGQRGLSIASIPGAVPWGLPWHAGEMLFFAQHGLNQPTAACCQRGFQACVARWVGAVCSPREGGQPGVQAGTSFPREAALWPHAL